MRSESWSEGYDDASDGLEPFMESEYSGLYEDYIDGFNEAHSMLQDWDDDEDLDYYDDEYDYADYEDRYDDDQYWA